MTLVDDIPQWSTADKDPGFYGQNKFGVGKSSVGQWPVVVVCTGTKTSDGSMTADLDVEQVFSLDEAIALAGARSTLVQQAEAAFAVGNANVILAPPLATGTGATAAVTIGGSWTTQGTPVFAIGGKEFNISVGATSTPSDVALALLNAALEIETMPVVGTAVSATTTFTVSSAGTQGNNYFVGWDLRQAPTGMTVTVSGATATHPYLVHFSGGAGTESVANLINLLEADQYDYIASAQNDAGNAALWKAHVVSEMQPTIAHLESVVFGHTGTLAAATSLASSTLNNELCSVIWYENCESHPAVIAAQVAALRSTRVGGNPNTVWAGLVLPSIVTQRYPASDSPNYTTRCSALNNGVTPLYAVNGEVTIRRDCVTKCLSGTTPTYKTYGWPDVDVSFRMRKEGGTLWADRRDGNPFCGPDVGSGEKSAAEGVETPSSLGAALTALWKEKEEANWLWDVDNNPITVVYDTTRRCLVWSAPVKVRPQNLQNGGTIRQTV